LQIDDDVLHIARWEKGKRIKYSGEEAIRRMVIKYSILAEDLGVRLWGININIDRQVYREYTPFSMVSYVSASFSCFRKDNDLFYDERFSLKEDYDMVIQQCNRYRRLLRINGHYYMKKGRSRSEGARPTGAWIGRSGRSDCFKKMGKRS